MEFQIVNTSPLATKADLLVVCTFGDPTKDSLFQLVDAALGGHLTERARAEEFAGRPGQVLFSDRQGAGDARAICLVGAGEASGFDPSRIRDVTAAGIRAARRIGAKRVVMALPPVTGRHTERTVQAGVEGALLGSYKFSKYRAEESKRPDPVETVLLTFERGRSGGGKRAKQNGGHTRELKAALERAQAVAHAICHARDLINEPAAVMTPSRMAEEAREVARKHDLQVKILGPKECEKLGMGMFLAVGQGSDEELRFIHLTYTPKKKPKKRVALIGKGVTFDSGGYSLKPSAAMEDMKIDMSGAAAVVAAMAAIAQIGSPFEVHAVAACCENLVSGHAYKLGDVLRSMDGTTVEINNTDAEGRLTLGDAITYVRQKVQPDQMIDLATLTGACQIALGPHMAGVMSDDESLAESWLAAARAAGEEMWRLPLHWRLRDQLKSPVADLRNTGERYGGALTAGLFLKHFARDTPWLHVDIAGPASNAREYGAVPRGGTGFAVATLVEFVTRQNGGKS
ncbi:MAG TPA: leucyl aminopeptidase [Kofleriaceae bacterium]|nr:leucyl aminopeptidase [Kofleriaceae bacterium]